MSNPSGSPDDPAFGKQTETNDAVAGEPVLEADSLGGPLGAEPPEAEPEMDENDLSDQSIDLDETPDGA